MARRRKLEAPTAADLDKLDADFKRANPAAAPIAQVAADAAGAAVLDPGGRAEAALEQAHKDGRLIVEIPLGQIEVAAMTRDRMDMSGEGFEELKLSIQANGLRLPIEVYALPPDPGGAPKYGLISGYRRLAALQDLTKNGQGEFATAKALIRPEVSPAKAFQNMVEENEVREDLSHFERGRIASLAAHQGAFPSTQAAVDGLFATGSKAKRSKIRSFAVIFDALGDLLTFPKELREKDGLQIANALRSGAEPDMRRVLEAQTPNSAEEERAELLAIAQDFLTTPKDPAKGGRPKKRVQKPGWINPQEVRLDSGISLAHDHDGTDHIVRIKGRQIDRDFMDQVLKTLHYMLDKPD